MMPGFLQPGPDEVGPVEHRRDATKNKLDCGHFNAHHITLPGTQVPEKQKSDGPNYLKDLCPQIMDTMLIPCVRICNMIQ